MAHDQTPLRRLIVERDGAKVRFTIECADIYDAIALYDDATAKAAAGGLDLTVATTSYSIEGERDPSG